MISLNNHSLRGTRGSALVVTILLVSVMLTAALILLQRIIPYAKNVRWMNDAAQAYYTARWETETARLTFFTGTGGTLTALRLPSLFWLLSSIDTTAVVSPRRGNIWCGATRCTIPPINGTTITESITTLAPPFILTNALSDHVISSANPELPLKIRLFEKDASPSYFGTSKRDKAYHTLDPNNSGGLRFDFRGVATKLIDNFGLKIKFKDAVPVNTNLTLKMQYSDGTTVKTFTNDYAIDSLTEEPFSGLNTLTGNIQTINADGTITAEYLQPLETFLNFDCSNATICSLSLSVDGTTPLDFQLISSWTSAAPLPDLNAVVIGDGLSENGLYFQRVIDLIPTPQDI